MYTFIETEEGNPNQKANDKKERKKKKTHRTYESLGAPERLSRFKYLTPSQLRSWYQGCEFEPHNGLQSGHGAYFKKEHMRV